MNLEKQRESQNTIKKLVVDDKDITDQTHILEHISDVGIPKISENQAKLCEGNLTKKDLYNFL